MLKKNFIKENMVWFVLAIVLMALIIIIWGIINNYLYKTYGSTPPQIELIGDMIITQAIGDEYQELGIVAKDGRNRDISNKVKIEGEVKSKEAGIYMLTYYVVDKYGNKSKDVIRIVRVGTPNIKEETIFIDDEELINIIKKEIDNNYQEIIDLKNDLCAQIEYLIPLIQANYIEKEGPQRKIIRAAIKQELGVE